METIKTADDVIIECRKQAIKKLVFSDTEHFSIRPDYENGKLVISRKRKIKSMRVMFEDRLELVRAEGDNC